MAAAGPCSRPSPPSCCTFRQFHWPPHNRELVHACLVACQCRDRVARRFGGPRRRHLSAGPGLHPGATRLSAALLRAAACAGVPAAAALRLCATTARLRPAADRRLRRRRRRGRAAPPLSRRAGLCAAPTLRLLV